MFPIDSLPETQAALALSIFFATFVYEDGATLLAATLSASGAWTRGSDSLPHSWVSGSATWDCMGWAQFRAAHGAVALAAEIPKARITRQGRRLVCQHGSLALVMSRAIPGSRLPLYVAAGALRLPVRLFAKTTAVCSAVWVSAIFAIWRFVPKHRRAIRNCSLGC